MDAAPRLVTNCTRRSVRIAQGASDFESNDNASAYGVRWRMLWFVSDGRNTMPFGRQARNDLPHIDQFILLFIERRLRTLKSPIRIEMQAASVRECCLLKIITLIRSKFSIGKWWNMSSTAESIANDVRSTFMHIRSAKIPRFDSHVFPSVYKHRTANRQMICNYAVNALPEKRFTTSATDLFRWSAAGARAR